MFARKAAIVAALSSLVLVSTAQANEGCWYPNESKAAQLLHLNTNLMVGALHCRQNDPAASETYDRFVESQMDILGAHHAILERRFAREYGEDRSGRDAYREYRISTANDYAAKPFERNDAECARLVSLARLAANMSDADLLILAESLASPPQTGPCRPSNFSYDASGQSSAASDTLDPWARLEAPKSAALTAAPQATANDTALALPVPAAAPPIVEAVITEPAAIHKPTEALEDTSLAAAPQEIPAGAGESRAQPGSSSDLALQSALAALQAATTALQMAVGGVSTSDAPAPQ
jgi:hypothetical protein